MTYMTWLILGTCLFSYFISKTLTETFFSETQKKFPYGGHDKY